jgi:hypothetical protein
MRHYRELSNIWNDDFAWLTDFFPTRTYSYSGRWVDPEKYDVIPKKEYLEKQIKEKEDEIARCDQLYEERRKRLVEEKENLIKLRK